MQQGRCRPMRWPPPLSRAHPPGVVALHTLAAPRTKPSNRSASTGGFRMFGVHACEVPQPPVCCPRGNRPSRRRTSTEFLYPSPNCDKFSAAWRPTLPAMGIHRTWRPHGRKCAPQRARSSNEYLRHPRVRAVTGTRRRQRRDSQAACRNRPDAASARRGAARRLPQTAAPACSAFRGAEAPHRLLAPRFLPSSEFFPRQRRAGGQGAKFLQCNFSVHRRHAAVSTGKEVVGGHVLQGLFYNVRDLFSRFDAIGRYVDDADQHVLALQQLQQLDRHLRMDAFERDLLDPAPCQGREDLRVLAPLAAERPLPVDVGLDAVAVADVHTGGALQALDRPVQRIDAPALHVVQVHVEGRLVELDHVDAVLLERARLLVQRSEEHTSELQSLAYLVCRLLVEKKKKKQTTTTLLEY